MLKASELTGLDAIRNMLYNGVEESSNSTQMEVIKRILNHVIAEELTSKQKEALTLYYYKHMSQKEISEITGTHKSVVSRHIRKAKTRIEKILKYQVDSAYWH